MKFHVSLSTEPRTTDAASAACREISTALGGAPDLLFLFVSPHHLRVLEEAVALVRAELLPRTLLGCSGEGIIGVEQEVEQKPAVCLWAARLPGVKLTPFSQVFPTGETWTSPREWSDPMPESGDRPAFLILAEPFSTPAREVLEAFAQDYPGAPILGGMASGGQAPGQNRVVLDDTVGTEGLVGVALTGAVRIATVVSQGCRPIGERFVVTRAEENIIYELGGRPALERLQEMFTGLRPEEQALARRGLHLGCATDEQKGRFERGDFVIRNLIGADESNGSIAITDLIEEGRTVQFQVRDAATATEDLGLLLETRKRQLGGNAPGGALLFSCNGRGRRLFGSPDHDISALRRQLGAIPVAGFFAQGEIGPVGEQNFLHGFTASVALFCRPS